MRSIILTTAEPHVKRVFNPEQMDTIVKEFGGDGKIYTPADLEQLEDAEYIFSTWGMPAITEENIRKYLPNLKAVFYAAGSVKSFAAPFLRCGVRVFSAWHANAVPVAEVSVAEIVLASKGFYYLSRICKEDYNKALYEIPKFPGNYRVKIGIIGLGAIGMKVVEMLKNYDVDLYVSSSKITKENEAAYGVHAATIDEIFSTCTVISNHLANVPETVGIIGEQAISKMLPYSTFINTGRGAQVDEAALTKKLASDPTITAVLDVIDPTPPVKGSLMDTLPNIVLTPHSAGSSGSEVQRMAQYMIDECRRYLAGEKCPYEVFPDMLSRMS